jgi:hypothetical protein
VISTAGRVAEWFKAAVLKTARAREGPRGFESLPFRQCIEIPGETLQSRLQAQVRVHSQK